MANDNKKTVDARIIKTKAAIRKAFNELVQTKEMSEISVSELSALAGITRSTFYMYYDSVEAVRGNVENEILENIEKVLGEQDWLSCMSNPYPLLDAICKEISRYDEYNRYILSSKNSGNLLNKLTAKFVKMFLDYVEKTNLSIDAAKAKYIAGFVAAGTLECFKMWYNHTSSLSLEELCQRISAMIAKGFDIIKDITV